MVQVLTSDFRALLFLLLVLSPAGRSQVIAPSQVTVGVDDITWPHLPEPSMHDVLKTLELSGPDWGNLSLKLHEDGAYRRSLTGVSPVLLFTISRVMLLFM